MYYVIGANGSQYGPIDEATVKTWIAEGRLGPVSLSFKTGEAGWVPLSTRDELKELFAAAPAPGTPGAPGAPPAPVPVGPETPKDWLTALLLSIFLGLLAVDRFYLGYTGLGVLKLVISVFTCGIAGWVWWIIDIILIANGSLRDAQGRPMVKK
jgi:hypothetical protein